MSSSHGTSCARPPIGLAAVSVVLVVVLLVGQAASAVERELVRSNGRRSLCELTAVEEGGRFRFSAIDGAHELTAAEFVRWGHPAEFGEGSLILLAGGGVIVGNVSAVTDDQLAFSSDFWEEQRIPLAAVHAVVFSPPGNRLQRNRLLDLLAASEGKDDEVLLANGDRLRGVVTGLSEKAIRFDTGAETLEIPRDASVTALRLDPSLVEQPASNASFLWIGFANGSRFPATAVQIGKGNARLVLLEGTALSTQFGPIWLGDTVFLQPRQDGIAYLSDGRPIGYRHEPFLDIPWPYRADRNVLGGGLRCGGRYYVKGLGVRSASQLVYDVPDGYARFHADVGIDDQAGRRGSAVFRVLLADEGGAWREAARSPTVRGADAPMPITVELRGAKRLTLAVEYADQADAQDYANWLDARLEE